jgi:hypothetical protein
VTPRSGWCLPIPSAIRRSTIHCFEGRQRSLWARLCRSQARHVSLSQISAATSFGATVLPRDFGKSLPSAQCGREIVMPLGGPRARISPRRDQDRNRKRVLLRQAIFYRRHGRSGLRRAEDARCPDGAPRPGSAESARRQLACPVSERRHELNAEPINHSFRATGITAYLANGGTLEHAQSMAAHESPRTPKLYDRTKERLTQDEIERIVM